MDVKQISEVKTGDLLTTGKTIYKVIEVIETVRWGKFVKPGKSFTLELVGFSEPFDAPAGHNTPIGTIRHEADFNMSLFEKAK